MATYTTADEIRAARRARGWSVAEAAREMKRRADRPLPDIASLERSWKRWEAGTTPNHSSRELLTNLFDRADRTDPAAAHPPARRSQPTVWRRWLAFELRRLRDEAGLSIKEAAQACRWSTARLGYIENVQQALIEDDLERLLTLYEVPADRWASYFNAAAEQDRGWWERFDDQVVPPWLSLFLGLEQGAREVRAYEALVIPALLQTHQYAAALARADLIPRTEAQVQELASVRIARQRVMTRGTDPAGLWCVIDEAAIRRSAGPPDLMADQLDHVAATAERRNVTVQVLPYSAVNPYAFGPFYLLGFRQPADPGVVYVEHRDGAVFLEEAHEVQAHSLVFQHLATLALAPDDSLAMLREIAGRLRP